MWEHSSPVPDNDNAGNLPMSAPSPYPSPIPSPNSPAASLCGEDSSSRLLLNEDDFRLDRYVDRAAESGTKCRHCAHVFTSTADYVEHSRRHLVLRDERPRQMAAAAPLLTSSLDLKLKATSQSGTEVQKQSKITAATTTDVFAEAVATIFEFPPSEDYDWTASTQQQQQQQHLNREEHLTPPPSAGSVTTQDVINVTNRSEHTGLNSNNIGFGEDSRNESPPEVGGAKRRCPPPPPYSAPAKMPRQLPPPYPSSSISNTSQTRLPTASHLGDYATQSYFSTPRPQISSNYPMLHGSSTPLLPAYGPGVYHQMPYQQAYHLQQGCSNSSQQQYAYPQTNSFACDLCGLPTFHPGALWQHMAQAHPERVDPLRNLMSLPERPQTSFHPAPPQDRLKVKTRSVKCKCPRRYAGDVHPRNLDPAHVCEKKLPWYAQKENLTPGDLRELERKEWYNRVGYRCLRCKDAAPFPSQRELIIHMAEKHK